MAHESEVVNTFQVRKAYRVNALTNQIRESKKLKHQEKNRETEPKPRLWLPQIARVTNLLVFVMSYISYLVIISKNEE